MAAPVMHRFYQRGFPEEEARCVKIMAPPGIEGAYLRLAETLGVPVEWAKRYWYPVVDLVVEWMEAT